MIEALFFHDLDKRNNVLSNLEYVTPKENIGHANRAGRMLHGETVAVSKMTPDYIRAMRALRTCGVTQRALAKGFGLSQATVWGILNRRAWQHV